MSDSSYKKWQISIFSAFIFVLVIHPYTYQLTQQLFGSILGKNSRGKWLPHYPWVNPSHTRLYIIGPWVYGFETIFKIMIEYSYYMENIDNKIIKCIEYIYIHLMDGTYYGGKKIRIIQSNANIKAEKLAVKK